MFEMLMFFLAGAALGGAAALAHNREPTTLFLLGGLYAIALGVCLAVGHSSRVQVMTLVTPFVVIAMFASLATAGLIVHWTAIVSRLRFLSVR